MENGFSLKGRKNYFLTLQKKDLVIKCDHVIKSGSGKLVGVKMKPTKKFLHHVLIKMCQEPTIFYLMPEELKCVRRLKNLVGL